MKNKSTNAKIIRLAAGIGLLAPGLALAQSTPAKLAAYWDYNDASASTNTYDLLHGFNGQMENDAAFSADGAGRTGEPGDRAMDFGTTSAEQLVRVPGAYWLNQLAADDKMSVSYWQKLSAVANSSGVWMVSPSSGQRGFQAHTPWSDRSLYFDSAGCCEAGTQRTSASIDLIDPEFDFTQWHHFALVKDGTLKQIWVDGILLIEDFTANPLPLDFTQFTMGAEPTGLNSMQGLLDDFAIYSAALTPEQISALASGASPDSFDADSDADGIPDWFEDDFGLDSGADDAAGDADDDGASNLAEYQRATLPNDADTDDDGVPDGAETGTGEWVSAEDRGTSPYLTDTDGDGLDDSAESNTGEFASESDTGSNPLLTDTDGDAYTDGSEVLLGSSPLAADEIPLEEGRLNLLAYWSFNDDSDFERTADEVHGFEGTLTNFAAYTFDAGGRSGQPGDLAVDFGLDSMNQMIEVPGAHWLNAAAVNDEITISFWQWNTYVANTASFTVNSATVNPAISANVPWGDSTIYFDTAGCCDAAAQRINANITTFEEDPFFDFTTGWHHYAFVKKGSLKQIWIDGHLFLEGQNTGVLPNDMHTLFIGSAAGGASSLQGLIDDFAVFGSALDASAIAPLAAGQTPLELVAAEGDSDGDGLPNLWEEGYGLNPNSPGDAELDGDADGLANLGEYQRETDPTNSDTDGDGLLDAPETGTGAWASAEDTGTSPLNPDSDGDGLGDAAENNSGAFVSLTDPGTDPNKSDTDGDGYGDAVEAPLGASPVDASELPVTPGGVNLLAHWDFNDPSNPERAYDIIHGFEGIVENFALYSFDTGGRSGQPGDYGMDFGFDKLSQGVRVPDAQWLNAAAPADSITITWWQMLYGTADASSTWIDSISAPGGRALQTHTPWSNRNIYFDTAGCCDPGLTRINAAVAEDFVFEEWHHFAFVKDGSQKQIYIDGELFHEGTNTTPLPADMYQIWIGRAPGENSNMQGVMDDYAIFASALSPGQVQALAEGASPSSIEPEPTTEFDITGATYADGALTLTWASEQGREYAILRSADLETWEEAGTITGEAGSTSFTDEDRAGTPAGFYRVEAR